MSRESIAKTLKRLREKQGLTADQVGAMIGKSGKTVNAWENNRGQPDAGMLMKLCEIYKVENILRKFQEGDMDIGEKISLYRKEKKITIDELVELSGVPKGTINKIIAGTTKAPTLDNIKAIAHALGKSLSDFDDSPKNDSEIVHAKQTHNDKGVMVLGTVKEEIAKNLQRNRKASGLTQKQLAEKLGVKNSAVSNWESGQNSIDIETLCKACEIFGVSLDSMYGRDISDTEFTLAEQQHIKKYRTLDAHGKRVVDLVLDEEAARVEADTAPPKMYHIKIAGFDGSFVEKDITEEEADAIRNLPEYDGDI